MNRKWMIWIAVPVLLTFLYGCPKKKPATKPADLDVETTTVPAPATPPSQPQDIQQPAAPPVTDTTESNPLESSDLQVVNEELRRRGFSSDVYFDYDDLLKSSPQFTITIEGHADERGTNEYNLALGERRASAVKDYITSLGVAGDRVRTISYGEERPVCTQNEESCWSQNRRAHMIITGRSNVG